MNTKEKAKIHQLSDIDDTVKSTLILHNDDHNSFDFVIDCLVDVCKHEHTQAEQCAIITHLKGKCDVKSGSFTGLKPFKDELISRGLGVTIENFSE